MRQTRLLLLAVLMTLTPCLEAAVVRLAPEFTIPSIGNKNRGLKSFRGQAVVLLVADSSQTRAFKKQVRYLEQVYPQFASKQVIFVAALKDTTKPIHSDIPFSIANNPEAVAASYGIQDRFNLVVIGKDGNVDYQTGKVCTGERVRDVVQNSFVIQTSDRKQ